MNSDLRAPPDSAEKDAAEVRARRFQAERPTPRLARSRPPSVIRVAAEGETCIAADLANCQTTTLSSRHPPAAAILALGAAFGPVVSQFEFILE